MWLTPPILTEIVEISGYYQKQVSPSSLTPSGLRLPTTSHVPNVPEPSKILQFADVNLHTTFIVNYKVNWYSFFDIFWLPFHSLNHLSTTTFCCRSTETCWTLVIAIIIALVLKGIYYVWLWTLWEQRLLFFCFTAVPSDGWMSTQTSSHPSPDPVSFLPHWSLLYFCGLYSTLLMCAKTHFPRIIKYQGPRLLYLNLLVVGNHKSSQAFTVWHIDMHK